MAELTAPRHEIIIERRTGWLRLELRELWEYRDLLALLVRRDWIARYQQTMLGPLWHLFQPLLTMAMFVIVFTRVAKVPTDNIPAPLFYLSGLLAWNYFSQNITTASGTFLNNQGLFSKVWFPRLVIPVAALTSNLAAIALQLVPFALVAVYYAITSGAYMPTWRILLLPLAALHVGAVSLGVGLLMASATSKYRDIVHLNQFIVQLWMFATPLIYPLSQVPAKWAWIEWFNPMAVPVESFRWCLLAKATITPAMLGSSLGLAIILVVAGVVAFQNAARSAVDNV